MVQPPEDRGTPEAISVYYILNKLTNEGDLPSPLSSSLSLGNHNNFICLSVPLCMANYPLSKACGLLLTLAYEPVDYLLTLAYEPLYNSLLDYVFICVYKFPTYTFFLT